MWSSTIICNLLSIASCKGEMDVSPRRWRLVQSRMTAFTRWSIVTLLVFSRYFINILVSKTKRLLRWRSCLWSINFMGRLVMDGLNCCELILSRWKMIQAMMFCGLFGYFVSAFTNKSLRVRFLLPPKANPLWTRSLDDDRRWRTRSTPQWATITLLLLELCKGESSNRRVLNRELCQRVTVELSESRFFSAVNSVYAVVQQPTYGSRLYSVPVSTDTLSILK